jgi:hypothetical protein
MMIKILYYTSAGVTDPEPDPELAVSDRNTETSYKAVLRIHDILGWIRIRGFIPLTNGSGSCCFRH